jgi:hypothetical protein
MKLSQVAILAYAALYFLLVSSMEAENVSQSYPLAYIGCSMLSQILVVAGVVLFALNAEVGFARVWRWLFPLMIAEAAVGLWFDATIPPDALQPGWALDVALSLWLMAPAYYFNYRVARYHPAEPAA